MNTSKRSFARRAALFLIPVAVLFIVYWNGLRNWFEQDDFAWLGLHRSVYDWPTFLDAVFKPLAQGTIRPWSERGFFLLFYRLFADNALPYHLAVFATQALNLVLLNLILWKLTASRLVAAAAPVFWTVNFALLTPLCWASDYNQIQCAFFLLLAFLLYLHGRYWWQFAVFVVGFGALEINIVYPAIVLAYVVLCRPSRKAIAGTLPLFAVSIAYYALHTVVAPRQTTGVYALHWDGAMVKTLWHYWRWAFVPANSRLHLTPVLVFTLLTGTFVFWEASKGRRLPLFFLLWFFVLLAPVLPLRDHVSDYYLALPVLGIGTIFALALGGRGGLARGLAALSICYLAIHIPLARQGTKWYLSHTRSVRSLVWGVRQARALHPGKTILITGVSDDLYLDSFAHSVFPTLDIPDVFLAPEMLPAVARLSAENPDAEGYVLPPGPTIHALADEKLQVYSAAGPRLKNVTSLYERTVGARYGWNPGKNIPLRVDAGSPLMAYLLGSAWYPPAGNFRWMPGRASFRIGAPRTTAGKLTLTGFCPAKLTRAGPLTLSVSVEGESLPDTTISEREASFSRSYSLPPHLAGRDFVTVTLAVNRTLEQPEGSPPLGLAFGVFEIR